MRPVLIPLLLLASAATAQDLSSAEAFDAATRGKTIVYGTADGAYGAEEYLDGHRVHWSFLDGDCLEGTWYAEAGAICFVYEDAPDAHCWRFRDDAGRLSAEFIDPEGNQSPVIALSESAEPLYCKGPKAGV